MSKKTEKALGGGFDLAEIDTLDESTMTVVVNDKPTPWVWVFAGPGHPRSIEQSQRVSRERLARERAQEQAQVNGKKWTAPSETPDEVLQRNVGFVVERMLDWYLVDEKGNRTQTAVTMNGEPFPFSPENARAVLSDRRKRQLLAQALEFLGDEKAFTQRSANS